MTMCSKKDVEDVVENSLTEMRVIQKTIADSIVEIKAFLINLPCNAYNEKIIGLEFTKVSTQKDISDLEKDRDTLYDRTRANGETLAALTKENEGQNKDSTKTWMIIVVIITFAFNLAGWFLRG